MRLARKPAQKASLARNFDAQEGPRVGCNQARLIHLVHKNNALAHLLQRTSATGKDKGGGDEL
jgi:hypothetical protein